MKSYIYKVIFAFTLLSCSTKKEDTITPNNLPDISKEFSQNLKINGGIKINGDLPNPTIGDFGYTNEITKTEIESDPYSGFSLEINSPEDYGIVFIKFDNSNEYFQLEFDEKGPIIQNILPINAQNLRIKSIAKTRLEYRGICVFPAFPNSKANASIQVCNLPKKNGKLDKSRLNEKKFWCPAKKITFNCKAFDCNFQKIANEFSQLNNVILSPTFTSNDCDYVKAKYDQLINALLPCSSINSSDKSTLQSLNNQMQSIDCSIFNLSTKKEFVQKVQEIIDK